MLKATFEGNAEGVARYKIEGTLEKSGAQVNATIEFETDGRDAWWDDEAEAQETAGIEPGDEDAGWDEVLLAIDAAGS